MKRICVLAFLILSTFSKNTKWGVISEEGVSVLTDETFDDFVNKNKYVLVNFYTPDCAACKKMAKGYSGLAKKFENSKKIALLLNHLTNFSENEGESNTREVKVSVILQFVILAKSMMVAVILGV